jgi:uncharacterized protein DUF507
VRGQKSKVEGERTATEGFTSAICPLTSDLALPRVKILFQTSDMLFSKEYVGYLAREVAKKLVASGLIETKALPALNEKVHAALLDELALEDRINDEVRVILEAYSDEMQKAGANYQEMFRKVKTELTKKYKAIL